MMAKPSNEMIDDTRGEPCTVTVAQISPWIDNIAKHRITQLHTRGWARRLRFLTFDGPGFSSQDGPAQCARCELGVQIPRNSHFCNSHRRVNRSNVEKAANDLQACNHIAKVTCSYCKDLPLFPNQEKATRFRIRRVISREQSHRHDFDDGYIPKEPGHGRSTGDHDEWPCGHFVAVSYCWAAPSTPSKGMDTKTEVPYRITEEDGSVRDARASKQTIHRAVNFAAQNGYRMIWIDQECIQQDDEFEQSIGVQAMDAVYLYAHITIGLFSAILDQNEWEAMLYWSEAINQHFQICSRAGPTPRRLVIRAENLSAALKKVLSDIWNTRAWILQEAIASTGKIVLLFPLAKPISRSRLQLVCHEKSFTEICVDFEILYKALNISHGILLPDPPQGFPREEMQKKLACFHPGARDLVLFSMSLGGSRSQNTCSAAMAVAYLRDRENSVVSDRLAIIANICRYDLRLDGTALQKSQRSLALCIMVLAIMNGDFSLMTPELYRNPDLYQMVNKSFMESIILYLQYLPSISANKMAPLGINLGPSAPESYLLSSNGLRLAGFLWKPHTFIHLPSIQKKYHQSWLSLNEERYQLILNYNKTPREHTPWQRSHSTLSRHMDRRKLAVTQIMFDTLVDLRGAGEVATADAIWQSVWDPSWPKGRTTVKKLIESVSQFPDNLQVQNRGEMFRLERTEHMAYHPEWLINRIISHGGLWSYSLVKATQDDVYLHCTEESKKSEKQGKNRDTKDLFDESYADDDLELPPTASLSSESQNDEIAEEHGDGFTRVCINGKEMNIRTRNTKDGNHDMAFLQTSLGLTMVGFMLQKTMEIFITRWVCYPQIEKPPGFSRSPAYYSQAAFLGNLDMFGNGKYPLGDVRCFHDLFGFSKQRAVFDVDRSDGEGSLVLTPFQLALEGIVAPDLRRMSISRVVDKVPVGTVDDGYETFRTRYMVKGMWCSLMYPGGRYNLI
ncbi:uncharacterized protein K460DRAFT_108754 [Cucurbitaria berberidis CBS 394.84]|uniref:Heterokaryon incompatibility domain-containing protein n=1 Tax=Cucurbitaria berberidis CBS 394.84 TaxID=1168544 RepID=A0A9P4GHU3_9PLEO|nr:uncharacterized protein K460DRAFT_108754 [Cucurbitaria berberidis CBS 394.84]KAF1845410.1 hypothetical protein K460DRAFT_108754 [Cucurbitaria berberidis CBS 394.84]